MSQVTASLVKELREKTGVGMMDCKTALKENNGDIEASIDWLRTKGIAKAAKKEGRIASEGLIAVEKIDNVASIIEVNSETDFVARNEDFQNIVKKLSILSTKSNNLEELLEKQLDEKDIKVKDYITVQHYLRALMFTIHHGLVFLMVHLHLHQPALRHRGAHGIKN